MPRLSIDIEAKLADFQDGLRRVEREAAGIGRRLETAFGGVGSALAGIGTALAGFSATGLFRDIFQRTAEAERGLASLDAVLRSTGFSAGQTAEDIERLANELKQATAFDDDEIIKAATALLRFRGIAGDTFRETLRLAPDLAVALGTDVASAAQALGRALESPESGLKGLRAAGVNLTDSQQELASAFMDAGNAAAAQRVVLDALAKSVGGAAAGENQGLYGASRSAAKAYDDLLKTIGGSSAFQKGTVAVLDGVANAVDRITDAFERASAAGARGQGLVDQMRAAGRAFTSASEPRVAEGRIRGVEDPQAAQARIGARQAELDRLVAAAAQRKRTQEETAAKNAARIAQEAARERIRAATEVSEYLRELDEKDSRESIDQGARALDERTERELEAARDAAERQKQVAEELDQYLRDLRKESTEEQIEQNARMIDEQYRAQEEQARKTQNAARQLGLTFASAFEDAIVGGEKLSDVIKGLAQDIARLLVRKAVVEPAADFLSGLLGGIFGGARAAGGPVNAGGAYLVGERGPELFVPGRSGTIVPNGAGGGMVINGLTIDARGADIGVENRLRAAIPAIIGATKVSLADDARRGRR
jgi:hypothetical protein